MGGRWADIGCGDGVFTQLLLEWLTPGSTVIAVDRDQGALRRLEREVSKGEHNTVQTLQADFTHRLPLPGAKPLDGILLANSLHFVTKQAARSLQPGRSPATRGKRHHH